MRNPQARWKLIALFLSTLLSLLLAEGVLQVHYRVTQGRWLVQRSTEEVDALEYAPPPHVTLRPERDPHYLYGAYGRPQPGDAQPVILTLGDSVPFGWGLPPGESYPAQLQRLLDAAGYSVRVVNGGAVGFTIGQALDEYRYGFRTRFPHLVAITVQAANDVAMVESLRESYRPGVSLEDVILQQQQYHVTRATHLALLHYWRHAVARLQEIHRENLRKRQGIPSPTEMMCAAVATHLDTTLASRPAAVPVILLPVDPYFYQTAQTERNRALVARQSPMLQQYYQRWAPIAAALDARLTHEAAAHPATFFYDSRATLDAEERQGLYLDHIHYSARGSALVAQGLLRFLQARQLLPPLAQPTRPR